VRLNDYMKEMYNRKYIIFYDIDYTCALCVLYKGKKKNSHRRTHRC